MSIEYENTVYNDSKYFLKLLIFILTGTIPVLFIAAYDYFIANSGDFYSLFWVFISVFLIIMSILFVRSFSSIPKIIKISKKMIIISYTEAFSPKETLTQIKISDIEKIVIFGSRQRIKIKFHFLSSRVPYLVEYIDREATEGLMRIGKKNRKVQVVDRINWNGKRKKGSF